ncbi:MAG: type II toxin-antitoxin system RelE/ParE family toxin [Micropepsaceae bacterium]
MRWTVETLNEQVDAELLALPEDMQARFFRIAELIEVKGLPGVREPHVKHLAGKIWEMRMSGQSGIARALYAAASPQRAVVLRVFIKKTQKTPQSEIDIALVRAKEI